MNMDESLKIAPEVATKVSQVIQRPDGSEVRIVVELPWLPGMGKSVGVSVWHRQLATDNWRLCSSHPHPDSREMSVDEYVKRGRPEMFQKASHAEILKLANLLGKPV